MLRNIRNHADYRLSDQRFVSASFIALQLAIAREVADALDTAGKNVPSFRSALRGYAKDVLKLPVRGID